MKVEAVFEVRRHGAKRQPAEYMETIFVPEGLVPFEYEGVKCVQHILRLNEPSFHRYFFNNDSSGYKEEFIKIMEESKVYAVEVDEELLTKLVEEGIMYWGTRERTDGFPKPTTKYIELSKELFGLLETL